MALSDQDKEIMAKLDARFEDEWSHSYKGEPAEFQLKALTNPGKPQRLVKRPGKEGFHELEQEIISMIQAKLAPGVVDSCMASATASYKAVMANANFDELLKGVEKFTEATKKASESMRTLGSLTQETLPDWLCTPPAGTLLGHNVIINALCDSKRYLVRWRKVHKRGFLAQRTVKQERRIYQLADGTLVMSDRTLRMLQKASTSDQAQAIETALMG